MEINEIKTHQKLYAVTILFASISVEIGSYIMIDVFYNLIHGGLFALMGFSIFYSIYWIGLMPVALVLIYAVLDGLILKPGYRRSEGEKLGKGDFYLTASPIVCLLLVKNLSEVIGNIYLMLLIAPFMFVVVFYFYKIMEEWFFT